MMIFKIIIFKNDHFKRIILILSFLKIIISRNQFPFARRRSPPPHPARALRARAARALRARCARARCARAHYSDCAIQYYSIGNLSWNALVSLVGQ
jgi:hypothetical protein